MERAVQQLTKLICALFISIISLNAFCANAQPLYKGKITIGTPVWPGYIGLYVAKAKGFFLEQGLDVDVIPYQSTTQLSQDYINGKLQGRGNVTLEAVNENAAGFDHKIILVVDYSNGSNAIVANKKVKTIKGLAGKKIGYEKDSTEEFFVASALAKSKMSNNSLNVKQANPEESRKLLLNGTIDAAVIHEPFLSETLIDPNMHVIFNSSNVPGLIMDTITFRTDFLDQQPETIKAFLSAYFKAIQYVKEHPQAAYSILAKAYSLNQDVVKKQMKGLFLLNKKDNETAFSNYQGYWSIYNNLKTIDDYVKTKKGNLSTLNSSNLVEPKFNVEAVNLEEIDTPAGKKE